MVMHFPAIVFLVRHFLILQIQRRTGIRLCNNHPLG